MTTQNFTHKPVVLIVEDEPLQLMMAVDFVEAAGFETLEAIDADEAVRTLEGRADICVVFTDIDMPGSMDGLVLARVIQERWPPIDLILTSSCFKAEPDRLPPGSAFLSQAICPKCRLDDDQTHVSCRVLRSVARHSERESRLACRRYHCERAAMGAGDLGCDVQAQP